MNLTEILAFIVVAVVVGGIIGGSPSARAAHGALRDPADDPWSARWRRFCGGVLGRAMHWSSLDHGGPGDPHRGWPASCCSASPPSPSL